MRTVEAMLTCPWCGEFCETTDQRVHVTCHVAELAAYKEAIQGEIHAKRYLALTTERTGPIITAVAEWAKDPYNPEAIFNLIETAAKIGVEW